MHSCKLPFLCPGLGKPARFTILLAPENVPGFSPIIVQVCQGNGAAKIGAHLRALQHLPPPQVSACLLAQQEDSTHMLVPRGTCHNGDVRGMQDCAAHLHRVPWDGGKVVNRGPSKLYPILLWTHPSNAPPPHYLFLYSKLGKKGDPGCPAPTPACTLDRELHEGRDFASWMHTGGAQQVCAS